MKYIDISKSVEHTHTQITGGKEVKKNYKTLMKEIADTKDERHPGS